MEASDLQPPAHKPGHERPTPWPRETAWAIPTLSRSLPLTVYRNIHLAYPMIVMRVLRRDSRARCWETRFPRIQTPPKFGTCGSHPANVSLCLQLMDQLPTEIVSAIFLLSLTACTFDSYLPVVRERHKDRKRLCLVSKLWRDIAYGTPSQWSLIYISEIGRVCDQAMAHLERAKRASLDIRIYITPTSYTSNRLPKAIEAACEKSGQWRSFAFVATTTAYLARTRAPSYPNLTEASITILSSFQAVGMDPRSTQIVAPNLRHLIAAGYYADRCLDVVQSSGITHCSIPLFDCDRELEETLAIMNSLAEKCPGLTYLEVGVKTGSHEGSDTESDVEPHEGEGAEAEWPTLAFLETVTCNGFSIRTLDFFLTRLNAPKLRTLNLTSWVRANTKPDIKLHLPATVTIRDAGIRSVRQLLAVTENANEVKLETIVLDNSGRPERRAAALERPTGTKDNLDWLGDPSNANVTFVLGSGERVHAAHPDIENRFGHFWDG